MEGVFTQVAYGLPRYMLPGGAIACVLAGVAAVWLAQEAERRLPGARLAGGRTSLTAVATVLALVALALPWALPRTAGLRAQGAEANRASSYISRMFRRPAGRGRALCSAA